jgi:pyrimidine operon attenuation protein/uracil phosphoribosyltransferase
MPEPTLVTLDDYRSEGARVFIGWGRGEAVAESIREKHGGNVEIVVPDDVIYIGTTFRAAFEQVLPDANLPDVP